jgi:hypothetical protein
MEPQFEQGIQTTSLSSQIDLVLSDHPKQKSRNARRHSAEVLRNTDPSQNVLHQVREVAGMSQRDDIEHYMPTDERPSQPRKRISSHLSSPSLRSYHVNLIDEWAMTADEIQSASRLHLTPDEPRLTIGEGQTFTLGSLLADVSPSVLRSRDSFVSSTSNTSRRTCATPTAICHRRSRM